MWPLNLLFILGFITVAAVGGAKLVFVYVLLWMPFLLPLGMLGCWRCNYNLLRKYRGANSVESGDSWTGEPLYPSRMVSLPSKCPRCGALILSQSINVKASGAVAEAPRETQL
jgi:hypothetical protein